MSAVVAPPGDATGAERPLQLVVVVLAALLLWVLRPVLGAILLGGFAVLVADRPYERLVVALRGRRKTAGALAALVLTVAVLVPLGLAAYAAIREAGDGVRWLSHQLSGGGQAALVERLPAPLRARLPSLGGALDVVVGWATRALSAAPHLVKSTGWLLTEALLTVVTMYYLFVEGPSMVTLLRRVSPLRKDQTEALLAEFRAVAVALFRGNLAIALFHGVTAAAGYAIFGVPRVLLLGALTAMASLVPIVGTSLVWLPLVIGLGLEHHWGRAIGLAIWCATVVGLSDNLLRPFVSRGHMALPRLLVFLTLFGGLEVFGPKGLLLGPLLGSLAVTAVRLLARSS